MVLPPYPMSSAGLLTVENFSQKSLIAEVRTRGNKGKQ